MTPCQLVLIVALTLLTGCTTGFQARVIEYDAEASWFSGAKVGGCVTNVVESDASAAGKASVSVALAYEGKTCKAVVKSK